VLVDVVTVLEVAMFIVNVVYMVAVRDGLTSVAVGVRLAVIGMDRGFAVTLSVVDVVDVVVVNDGLVAVTGKVLMIAGLRVPTRRFR